MPLPVSSGLLAALYNALWYPAFPFALLASGGREGLDRRERMGTAALPTTSPGAPRFWIHAASVGEVEAVRPVALGLMREYPDAVVVVTTMTSAGRAAAVRRIPGAAACRLAPLDCALSVRSFLAAVSPQIVVIAETEIWPNYLIEAARSGAKVAVVNGRISARSMRRYRYIRPLIAEALAHTDLVLAQTGDDADRFCALGAPFARVAVTGNTKFDLGGDAPPLRSALVQFCAGRPVLVAGSTAPGEERMILTAYRNLLERFPALALVLAPRHLDRADEIANEIRAAGFSFDQASSMSADATPGLAPRPDSAASRTSAAPSRAASGLASDSLSSLTNAAPQVVLGAAHDSSSASPRASVLLLDTMGELRALYSHATLALVGGSLTPLRGGQNVTEPAAVGVPVMFGPHYENQQQAGDAILAAGGGAVVADAAQIESTCAEWLDDPAARSAAGVNALRAVGHLSGGVAATISHLKALIGPPH
jgi:3-deoxy-D-manno-octulosonic-acid transferase